MPLDPWPVDVHMLFWPQMWICFIRIFLMNINCDLLTQVNLDPTMVGTRLDPMIKVLYGLLLWL